MASEVLHFCGKDKHSGSEKGLIFIRIIFIIALKPLPAIFRKLLSTGPVGTRKNRTQHSQTVNL